MAVNLSIFLSMKNESRLSGEDMDRAGSMDNLKESRRYKMIKSDGGKQVYKKNNIGSLAFRKSTFELINFK